MRNSAVSLSVALALALIWVGIAPAASDSAEKRVLVVTSDPAQLPVMYAAYNGQFVITDLTAAGYPFDVVTYPRFVEMPLTNHDVIILNGHTSPVDVATVLSKCQSAIGENRKVFVNGAYCFSRCDSNGNQTQYLRYSLTLFGAKSGPSGYANGSFQIPACIEKDPALTALEWTNFWASGYTFDAPPPLTVSIGGKVIGFLGPKGGVLDTNGAAALTMLDYGKIVSYLRFGGGVAVGFANDRIQGRPVVSFEVHCDSTNDLVSIDALRALSDDYGLPLFNLLVYNRLNSSSINRWNSVAGPLMRIGSHSRTHPMDWPSVSDIAYETTGAIAAQRELIPATEDVFNWSGSMNPTQAQIEYVYSSGILAGCGGGDERTIKLPSGVTERVQRMPTRLTWFQRLATSTNVPYLLSQTLASDYHLWTQGKSYLEDVMKDFELNVKYGMYTYGYFHDYSLDPATPYYVGGVHLGTLIRSTVQYLSSKNVAFIPLDELLLRLRDFLAGYVTCQPEEDGSVTVCVGRPLSKANQIKVLSPDGLQCAVWGSSVLSRHTVGRYTYVDLKPETTSTIVVTPVAYLGDLSGARKLANGNRVEVRDAVVTAVFDDSLYIEQPDRSSGVKVLAAGAANVGDCVDVIGTLGFRDGERVIEQARIQPACSSSAVRPLGIPGRAVGGNGLSVFDPGIDLAMGPFNVGLLITTWGKVTYADPYLFYIDDGSHLDDGSGHIGIRVDARCLTSVPGVGEHVSVTGISTVQVTGARVIPVVRPRNQQDIVVR